MGGAVRLCSLVESRSPSSLNKPRWVDHRVFVDKDREVGPSLRPFVTADVLQHGVKQGACGPVVLRASCALRFISTYRCLLL